MLAKVFTATLIGLEAKIIEIEVDIAQGERNINIVGLADKAVRESKDRILSAFRNNGITLGSGRKIVSLAPSDIPKIGTAYDLPMAVGLLLASGEIQKFDPAGKLFFGELSLTGNLRSVRGLLALVDSAKRQGFRQFFVPEENAKEATLVKDAEIFGVRDMRSLLEHFSGKSLSAALPCSLTREGELQNHENDFANIRGQHRAKRALEVAAAGGHNILFCGVPGSGKTYMAKAFSGILPEMTTKESLEVTRIYSLAGNIKSGSPLIRSRPFRDPHHTITQSALVGGGSFPKPGEVTLAHRGVLFLDELPEFDLRSLEVLRQPMEDKKVSVSRARSTLTFPANFQLIAAMNPCKCGYFGDNDKACKCSENERRRYLKRISGPIIDRIDMFIEVHKLESKYLNCDERRENSHTIAKRVQAAREIQLKRFMEILDYQCNADILQENSSELIKATIEAKALLVNAITKLSLSARGFFNTLKVARTIADLEKSEYVEIAHMQEALSYRGGSVFLEQ